MFIIRKILLILCLASVLWSAEIGLWTFDTLGNPVIVTLDTIYLSMGDTATGRDTAITDYFVRGYQYVVELPATWDTAGISYRAVTDTPLVGFISLGSWTPSTAGGGSGDTNTIEIIATAVRDTMLANADSFKCEGSIVSPLIAGLTESKIIAKLNGESRKPIEVYRGDSKTISIAIVDADGSAVDISGASAVFTARNRENDSTAIIEKSLTITDAVNGKMRLDLTPTETTISTKSYPADIELTLSDGSVRTIRKSTLKIRWDVSR